MAHVQRETRSRDRMLRKMEFRKIWTLSAPMHRHNTGNALKKPHLRGLQEMHKWTGRGKGGVGVQTVQQSRGAACLNSRPQPGAKTFGVLEGGGGRGGRWVGRSATGVPRGGRWVTQHTYLKMIPMTR